MVLPRIEVEVEADTAQATRNIKRFSDDLEAIPRAAATANSSSKTLTSGVSKFGASALLSSNRTRQLTQQLSQVSQQSLATGNVMQAFAIQAADIGLAFGTVGTIVGTLAGVALPTLVAAFSDASNEVEEFDEQVDLLQRTLGDLRDVQSLMNLSIDELTERFGFQAQVVQGLIRDLANYRVAVAQDDLREAAELAQFQADGYARLSREVDLAAEMIDTLNRAGGMFVQSRIDEITAEIAEEAQIMGEQFGITADEAITLSRAFAELGAADTTADLTREVGELNDLMEELGISTEAIPDELQEAIARMAELGILTAELETTMARVAANAAGITTGVPLFMQGFSGAELLPPSARPGAPPPPGRGGGRRSRTGIQAIIRQLETEAETIERFRVEGLQKLQEANAKELEVLGGFNAAKLRLEEEYQSRLAQLRQREQAQTLSSYGTLFGNLATVFQSGSGNLLKIGKAFSVAQGLINSYRAYTEVLADPSLIGRPFLRQALAASTLAAGLAQVASIRSVSASGGGGGGGGGAGAATAAAPAQRPLDVRLSGVGPNDLFTGAQLSSLFDNLQDEAQDRGLNVSFAQ